MFVPRDCTTTLNLVVERCEHCVPTRKMKRSSVSRELLSIKTLSPTDCLAEREKLFTNSLRSDHLYHSNSITSPILKPTSMHCTPTTRESSKLLPELRCSGDGAECNAKLFSSPRNYTISPRILKC